MADEPRPRLGRGLAALLGESASSYEREDSGRGVKRLPIEFLRPNPRNPRKNFAEDQLESLVESIREKGVIQPILARPLPGTPGAYEIIAGERRWRAAQKAGLHEIPVLALEVNDKETLEIAIIENVQRHDLNAIEEALGYEQLIAEFEYSQADLAKVIGKSRSHIANTLRLLKLPDGARNLVVSGELTAGHARALLSVSDPGAVAQKIIREGLSVRDVEQIARAQSESPTVAAAPPRSRVEKDPDTRRCEQDLSDALGLDVRIETQGSGGKVVVKFSSLDQLDMLIAKLRS